MDTPNNKEVPFLSNKKARIRLQHPRFSKHTDEVRVNLASLTCQKGETALVEEAAHSRSYTCEVCQKSFPSINSLSGHKRVHRMVERKKLVIDDSGCTLSPSEDKDEEVTDSRWSSGHEAKKRKNYEDPQSKDAVLRHSGTIMFLDTQGEVRNGAMNLFLVKYGKDWDTYNQYSSTSTKRLKITKDINVASSPDAQEVVVKGYDIGIGIYYRNKQRELKDQMAARIPIENESTSKEKDKCMAIIPYVGNSSSTQVPIASSPNIPTESVRSLQEIITSAGKTSSTQTSPTENERSSDVNKGKKIMTAESSKADGAHVCHICHMSFSKPQALGGHMTLHRAKEEKIQGDERVNKKKNDHQEEHECEICKRKFPTGQKLGGHKRAHYDKEKLKKRKCKDIGECMPPVNSKEEGLVVVKNAGVPGTEEAHGGVEEVNGGFGDELSMVNSKEEVQVMARYVCDHGTEEAHEGVKHGFDLNLEPMERDGEN